MTNTLDPFPIFFTNVPGSKIQLIARRDSITGQLHASSILYSPEPEPRAPPDMSDFLGLGVRVITGPEAERLVAEWTVKITHAAQRAGQSVEEYLASRRDVTDVR